MECFDSKLVNLPKELLLINDICSLVNFLNSSRFSFVLADSIHIILCRPFSRDVKLFYYDQEQGLQNFEYKSQDVAMIDFLRADFKDFLRGERLYQEYPKLYSHPAYQGVKTYHKYSLHSVGECFGFIEYINANITDNDTDSKKIKLLNNMIATLVEHITEVDVEEKNANKGNHDHFGFQILVDVTNAVISRGTKKDLLIALLKVLYQYLGITDLSMIESHDGCYLQHCCSYEAGRVDYYQQQCSSEELIGHLASNKPMIFGTQSINENGAAPITGLFPNAIKAACIVPMVFRTGTLGYLGFMMQVEHAFQASDLELFQQITARVALANYSLKFHTETYRTLPSGCHVSIEDNYTQHAIFDEIISQSETMNRVLDQVAMVADCDSTVLLLGESGTGKELIARAVHKMSRRSHTAMVKMNCAAVPVGLFESELFGHERGAFTGAISKRVGRFEQAHNGTLFLDEIGDMPLELQPKLLRALQESEIERVGKNQLIAVDVRIVVATNADLHAMVESKTFRSDLYYRLNVFPIEIPPLRERPEDVPLLVKHFTRVLSKKMGKSIDVIPAGTLSTLCDYHWPGNVRQLRNLIERSVILTRGNVLNVPTEELRIRTRQPKHGNEEILNPVDQAQDRELIIEVLKKSNGIISGPRGAAAKLGVKRTTLLSRMQKMGIRNQDYLEDFDDSFD